MKQERVCFLCGRNGAGDPLDEHHVFNNSNRSRSDELGLTVYLCHERCHIFGKYAVHHNAYVMNELKRYTQREFMMREGVDITGFRLMFGKSYIGEDEGNVMTLFDLPVEEREAVIESPQSRNGQDRSLRWDGKTACHDQCAHWSRNDRGGRNGQDRSLRWDGKTDSDSLRADVVGCSLDAPAGAMPHQCAHWSRNDRTAGTVSEADALWESAKREYRSAMDAVRAAIRYDEGVLLPF